MLSNAIKCYQMLSNAIKCYQLLSNAIYYCLYCCHLKTLLVNATRGESGRPYIEYGLPSMLNWAVSVIFWRYFEHQGLLFISEREDRKHHSRKESFCLGWHHFESIVEIWDLGSSPRRAYSIYIIFDPSFTTRRSYRRLTLLLTCCCQNWPMILIMET